MVVSLDTMSYPGLADGRFIREIINGIRRLRKKAGLAPVDVVRMQYSVTPNPESVDIPGIVASQQSLFTTALRGNLEQSADKALGEHLIMEEQPSVT